MVWCNYKISFPMEVLDALCVIFLASASLHITRTWQPLSCLGRFKVTVTPKPWDIQLKIVFKTSVSREGAVRYCTFSLALSIWSRLWRKYTLMFDKQAAVLLWSWSGIWKAKAISEQGFMSAGVLLKGERQTKYATEVQKGYLNGKTGQSKTNTFWKKVLQSSFLV